MSNCSYNSNAQSQSGDTSGSPHLSCGVSMSMTPNSIRYSQPPQAATSSTTRWEQSNNNGALDITAMKAILRHLGSKSQASCRSTCSGFAIAFADLVEEQGVTVAATATIHDGVPAKTASDTAVINPPQHSQNSNNNNNNNNSNLNLPRSSRIRVFEVPSAATEETLGSISLEVRSTDITLEPPLGCDDEDDVSCSTSPLTLPRPLISDQRAEGVDDDGVMVEELRGQLRDGDDSINCVVLDSLPQDFHQRDEQVKNIPTGAVGRHPSFALHPSLFEFAPSSSFPEILMSSSSTSLRPKRKNKHMGNTWMKWAPASLTSPHLGNLHVVVNIEVLALTVTNPSVGYSIKPSPKPRLKYLYIHILDGLCAHLVAKSVEFIGMTKVVSIGCGMLLDAHVESITFSKLPRLAKVEDDWMAGCIHLRHVHFVEPLPKLKVVRHGWMRGCRALHSFDLTPFLAVEHVGDYWLSHCESLQYANFSSMPFLMTVGNFWLNRGISLRRVSFRDMVCLVRVGTSWLAQCGVLEEVTFVNTPSLQVIGEEFGTSVPPTLLHEIKRSLQI